MKRTYLTEQDQATVFVLAGQMIDVATKVAMKEPALAFKSIAMVPDVLKTNPGFLDRFRKEQKDVLAEFERLKSEETPGTSPSVEKETK